jgi:uncharacterized protein with GYD domain
MVYDALLPISTFSADLLRSQAQTARHFLGGSLALLYASGREEEETRMSTFIALLDYTDQGIREIKNSPYRADQFNAAAERAGAKVVAQYWTIGSHDGVLILEAPNDEVAASVLLSLGASGNVRTTTLRAFEWAEAQGLIDGP